jgi:hypothetical protein
MEKEREGYAGIRPPPDRNDTGADGKRSAGRASRVQRVLVRAGGNNTGNGTGVEKDGAFVFEKPLPGIFSADTFVTTGPQTGTDGFFIAKLKKL